MSTEQPPTSGPVLDTPTQVAQPGKATLRTIVQTAISVILGAAILLPLVWGIITDELGRQGFTVPPEVTAVVVGSLAAIVALSGILTRVMAIPAVNALLARVGLQAGTKAQAIDTAPRR